jgi:hypothetical protein
VTSRSGAAVARRRRSDRHERDPPVGVVHPRSGTRRARLTSGPRTARGTASVRLPAADRTEEPPVRAAARHRPKGTAARHATGTGSPDGEVMKLWNRLGLRGKMIALVAVPVVAVFSLISAYTVMNLATINALSTSSPTSPRTGTRRTGPTRGPSRRRPRWPVLLRSTRLVAAEARAANDERPVAAAGLPRGSPRRPGRGGPSARRRLRPGEDRGGGRLRPDLRLVEQDDAAAADELLVAKVPPSRPGSPMPPRRCSSAWTRWCRANDASTANYERTRLLTLILSVARRCWRRSVAAGTSPAR